MLTSHVYWNLDAFKETQDVFGHILGFGASRRVEVDGYQVPTGNLLDVTGTAYDLREPIAVGTWFTPGNFSGYDDNFIYDEDKYFSVWSPHSGIRMDVTTDQKTVQVYTGNGLGQPGNVRKRVHGGPGRLYQKWSGIAFEQQGYIDAINNPSWKQDHIYGPERAYHWETSHKFSIVVD